MGCPLSTKIDSIPISALLYSKNEQISPGTFLNLFVNSFKLATDCSAQPCWRSKHSKRSVYKKRYSPRML